MKTCRTQPFQLLLLRFVSVCLVFTVILAGTAVAQTKPTAEIEAWIDELKDRLESVDSDYDLNQVKARLGRAYIKTGIKKAVFADGNGIYQLWHRAKPEYQNDIIRLGEWRNAVEFGMVSRDRALAVLAPRVDAFRRLDQAVKDELADQFERTVARARLQMTRLQVGCCNDEYTALGKEMDTLLAPPGRSDFFRKAGQLNLIPKVEDFDTLRITSVAEADNLIEDAPLACQDAPEEMASDLVAWMKANADKVGIETRVDDGPSTLLTDAPCEASGDAQADPDELEALAKSVGVSAEACRQRVAQSFRDFLEENKRAAWRRLPQLVNDDADYAEERRVCIARELYRQRVENLALLFLQASNSWCGPGAVGPGKQPIRGPRIEARAPLNPGRGNTPIATSPVGASPASGAGHATQASNATQASQVKQSRQTTDSTHANIYRTPSPQAAAPTRTAVGTQTSRPGRPPRPAPKTPAERLPEPGKPPSTVTVEAADPATLVDNATPIGMRPALSGLDGPLRDQVLTYLYRSRNTDIAKFVDCHGSSALLWNTAQTGSTSAINAWNKDGIGIKHAMFIFGKGQTFEAIDTRPAMWREAFSTRKGLREGLNRASPGLADKLAQGAVLNEAEYNAYMNYRTATGKPATPTQK